MNDNGWISVEDRLPERYGRYPETSVFVLCIHNGGTPYAAHSLGAYNFARCYWYNDHNQEMEDITHWQPLPEPPKTG